MLIELPRVNLCLKAQLIIPSNDTQTLRLRSKRRNRKEDAVSKILKKAPLKVKDQPEVDKDVAWLVAEVHHDGLADVVED
jgi:hypothetical protein